MVRAGGADRAAVHARGKRGRPPFPVESMLRIHFMQQWFTLSDPAMEEALMTLFRDSPAWAAGMTGCPDESTILRFRHVLEKHKTGRANPGNRQFAAGCQGPDAAAAQWSIDLRTKARPRTPAVNETRRCAKAKKGQQWFFGMKAHRRGR